MIKPRNVIKCRFETKIETILDSGKKRIDLKHNTILFEMEHNLIFKIQLFQILPTIKNQKQVSSGKYVNTLRK